MSKQDYIPGPDANFLNWMQNFKTQVAATAATFGLTAAEATAVDTDFTAVQTRVNTLNTKKAEQAAAAADKQAARGTAESHVRALANRIKAHPSFTNALGLQLGIIGPEDSTDLTTSKPTLQLSSIISSSVTINFNKSISSGIRLESKRAAETAFTFLAIDTASPYTDTRPNASPGPETRQYRAQYLVNDDVIGLLSDVLTVTVPE